MSGLDLVRVDCPVLLCLSNETPPNIEDLSFHHADLQKVGRNIGNMFKMFQLINIDPDT